VIPLVDKSDDDQFIMTNVVVSEKNDVAYKLHAPSAAWANAEVCAAHSHNQL